jgi:hypothetical protein
MKNARTVSLGELENTAKSLDLQILKLDRRGAHATPQEHWRALELKKLRLATLDRLAELKHRYSS